MSAMTNHLLIIDPQNDFCDLPDTWQPVDPAGGQLAPSLPVPGAHEDMLRLAALVDACGVSIDAITITLDSHQRLDIGHPGFWMDDEGALPEAFTTITAKDVLTGRWSPRNMMARARVLDYLQALEAGGRYAHMVWPVHCEIGSWGHNVHRAVNRACSSWEDIRGEGVVRVMKGLNPWTEHYSAIRAEVPEHADDHTQVNQALLARLGESGLLLVAGEAGSHCVRATVEHLVGYLPELAPRMALVTDCMSPVSGFGDQYRTFLEQMAANGVRLVSAAQVPDLLRVDLAETAGKVGEA